MIPPTSIDGTDITGATIDGTDVQEITVDGQTVFTAGAPLPTNNLVHRYDFSAPSTTTTFVEDLAGSDDLTIGSFSGFRTLNGLQVGDFDNDIIQGSWGVSLTEPFSTVIVVKMDTLNGVNILTDGFASFTMQSVYHDNNNRWQMFNGNGIGGTNTPSPTNANYVTAIFDSTDELYVSGSFQVSGNAGSRSPGGISLGDDHDRRGLFLDGFLGEVLVYDSDLSTNPTRGDVEQYITDKWGL